MIRQKIVHQMKNVNIKIERYFLKIVKYQYFHNPTKYENYGNF